ncbi:MAG: ATP-grasp domain-containing protein [Methanobrevibacter sp.]|uniref:ATP-grasp domain-containing protein n=1 Tax=Methanobrevibacter sp. TaxID=66852 RepID=UPI0026DFE75A|nr:ATP-grasp domain-containing protein [Methanobrevibacter sp.]MDO5848293.1 ATP-grasp domain-containing protein [Methanobrevibacter sp.]
MTNTTKNSILAFEYFTASGENDKCISSEAEALIRALLDDLKDFDVTIILNNTYKHVADGYSNVNPIIIEGSLEDYLKDNLDGFEKAIYIAAENDNHLYNIAKILEDKDIFIYNSNSEACFKSSDKFELFESLYGAVPQPLTNKFKIDSKGYWKRAVENLYKKWQAEDPLTKLKLIIKPINGVDCENVVILNDIDELSYDLEDIFPPGSRILVQEFIDGEDISVSLMVHDGKAIPLSINKQFVEIKGDFERYLGGMLPYETDFKDQILEVAIKACETLEGLNGFVGVDLRLNPDETDLYNVYLIEINSRFTTPYVGLQKIANFNIANSIIDWIDGKMDSEDLEKIISFDGHVEFKKVKDHLMIEVF